MPQAKKLIVVSKEQHIALITFNRPEKLNAINQQLADELISVLEELSVDDDLRVLIITGAGRAFAAGADLKARSLMGLEETRHHRQSFLKCMNLVMSFPTPTIAALNGLVIGGGMELALACDIRIAAEDMSMGLPEIYSVGAFAGGGGPVILNRYLPAGWTKYLVFTGRRLNATEAFRLGLIESVVQPDALVAESRKLASEMSANSPLGLRGVKTLINESMELPWRSSLILSTALRDPLDLSKDYREAINAFVRKEKPQLQGR